MAGAGLGPVDSPWSLLSLHSRGTYCAQPEKCVNEEGRKAQRVLAQLRCTQLPVRHGICSLISSVPAPGASQAWPLLSPSDFFSLCWHLASFVIPSPLPSPIPAAPSSLFLHTPPRCVLSVLCAQDWAFLFSARHRPWVGPSPGPPAQALFALSLRASGEDTGRTLQPLHSLHGRGPCERS